MLYCRCRDMIFATSCMPLRHCHCHLLPLRPFRYAIYRLLSCRLSLLLMRRHAYSASLFRDFAYFRRRLPRCHMATIYTQFFTRLLRDAAALDDLPSLIC